MTLPWYLTELDPRVYLDTSRWITLDFETTNLEKGSALEKSNRVVLASWMSGRMRSAWVHDEYTHPTNPWYYLREFCSKARVLVAHNAKFELQWLRRMGITTDHLLVLDTLIAEYVLAGNRRWALDLDSVGRRYGLGGKDPVIDALMRGGICPSEMPRERLKARVRLDVETTFELAKRQVAELDRLGLLPVLFTRCIATPVLAHMETFGMTLDESRVLEEYEATMTRIGEIEQDLNKVANGKNMRSPKQMAELLYDELKFEELKDRKGKPKRKPLTKTQRAKGITEGARLTDADTLDKLKAKTAAQRRFLELRKEWGAQNARVTKSLEFFKHICDERGGRFFGSLNQTRTKTHRLASTGRRVTFSDGFAGGAQFQNLANDLKRVFCASSSDHVLYEADGSGIEFRVAGELGKDEQAKSDIESGADIHRYTASVINGVQEDQVTKEMRRLAKPDTFGPLYGKVSGTKGQVAYFEAFKAKYAGIAKTQNAWVSEVLRKKELVLPWGMRFYWPFCRMDARGYVEGRTQAMNYPIQSFATADIVPIALVYTYWRVKEAGLRCNLINTVHDSILADIHKDDVQEYTEIVVTSFLDCVYEYLERVYKYDFCHIPLGVGMSVASHWGDGSEDKVSYGKAAAKFRI